MTLFKEPDHNWFERACGYMAIGIFMLFWKAFYPASPTTANTQAKEATL